MNEWERLFSTLRTCGLSVAEIRSAIMERLREKARRLREEQREREFQLRQMSLFEQAC